ncbi:hypothetical protein FISHEDRAFT_40842 [Fistulina hepatica ATCC 64428]|uniref:Uncharacterized protein n=1 Tax=Fistulina hepatica ATCC 64428 TaxID=1128425 RepID=A0A0D7AFK2_9AGAR|nr:hypothetical protein FISHEDRAFT_40842 [Fistulina hepatica ATCC 64428]
MVYKYWNSSATAELRANVRARDKTAKTITTTPGVIGAGETETEIDEPARPTSLSPRRLPTARIIAPSEPLVPPNNLQRSLTPLLFEVSRLASIVPAFVGTMYNLHHLRNPPEWPRAPERIDYFVAALWVRHGLMGRWQVYYTPLPTLIRLVSLQAICWQATHLALVMLNHTKRPVVVWAVIGTTTCVSRSVQIWVTSNLWLEPPREGDTIQEGKWHLFRGGQWGGRRWDWKVVALKCMLPAGMLYFISTFAEQLRREISGC